MDFFNRALASAREQATKAAADAKVLAEQAHAAARQQAEEAHKRFQSLPGELQSLDLNTVTNSMKESMTKALSGAGTGSAVSTEEMVQYGLTDEFVQHVKELSYMTFREYPEDQLVITRDLSPRSQPKVMKLGPWQAKHAMLLVQAVPEFNDLRYVLCPSKMTEERFWETYFMLNRDSLPEEATLFDILDTRPGPEAKSRGTVAPREDQIADGALDNFDLDDDDGEGGVEEDYDEEDEDYEPYEAESPVKAQAPPRTSGGAGKPSSSPARAAAAVDDCQPAAGFSPTHPEEDVSVAAGTWAGNGGRIEGGGPGEAPEAETTSDEHNATNDDDDDFDAYVNGMLGSDGGEGEEDGEEEDVDDEDFDAYMNELAKGTGSGEEDDADVSLDSQDIDLAEFEDEDES